jgi:glutathione S-transferase
MSLTLYLHPLASFCHKVLIALYEKDIPFTPHIVDLMDEKDAARFLDLWPVGKIPVLRDEQADRTIPETTIIIEYLEQLYPAQNPLFPSEDAARLDARLWDRFFDLYVQMPMQRIVTDRLRREGERDASGVAEANAALGIAYDMIERQLAEKSWAIGDAFSISDCAAAPALFYAGIVTPFNETHPNVSAYFERLLVRPSVLRVIDEARPYFHMFPFKDEIPLRFLPQPSIA